MPCRQYRSPAVLLSIVTPLITFLVVAGPGWAADVNSPAGRAAWKYVVPADESDRIASARTIWLSDSPPSDVTVAIPNHNAQYAELRYGSSDSRRVVLVLAQDETGGRQLYADRDRDRKINAADKLVGVGPEWQFSLDTEFVTSDPNDPVVETRQVLLRMGEVSRTLTLTTLGFLEGPLRLDTGDVQARVTDRDANGRFGDADDVLWCDVNRDGNWNAFLERMSCTPVVRLAGQRYHFSAAEHGDSFRTQLLTGTGSIRFALGVTAKAIVRYRILLVGRDGMAVSASNGEHLNEVPVGEYRIATLALTLRDVASGRPWSYLLSGVRSAEDVRWCEVVEDQTTRLELLDGLAMSLKVAEPKREYEAGETLFVTPLLSTKSGLIMNNCWRGEDRRSWARDGGCATIRITDAVHSSVVGTSGFA